MVAPSLTACTLKVFSGGNCLAHRYCECFLEKNVNRIVNIKYQYLYQYLKNSAHCIYNVTCTDSTTMPMLLSFWLTRLAVCQSLDLTNNAVANDGGIALAVGLTYNRTLTLLDMTGNIMGDKSMEVSKAHLRIYSYTWTYALFAQRMGKRGPEGWHNFVLHNKVYFSFWDRHILIHLYLNWFLSQTLQSFYLTANRFTDDGKSPPPDAVFTLLLIAYVLQLAQSFLMLWI